MQHYSSSRDITPGVAVVGAPSSCKVVSTKVRRNGTLKWLRPDAKSQVTLRYGADGRPEGIDAVVLSGGSLYGLSLPGHRRRFGR